MLRGGFDASWLITPALTATITVNTDFAEAEADVHQVHLSRFPLFFPEKRDFYNGQLRSFWTQIDFRPSPHVLEFARLDVIFAPM